MTDLMTYLHDAWKKHLDEDKEQKLGISAGDAIEHFVDFCKKQLKGNPPSGVFMAIGVGLRLADGTEVQVVEPPAEPDAAPDSILITKPRSLPGQHGITDTKSVPVFGGK